MSLTLNANDAALCELFSAATAHASESVAGWTGGQVTLRLEGIERIAFGEHTLEPSDDPLTAISLSISGNSGGRIVLTFGSRSGKELAALLLGREPVDSPEWSEIEMSALLETGNILACAYVRSIAETAGRELVPSPPQFIQDFGDSVLEQAIMEQAVECDEVVLCQTSFQRAGADLDWNVYFIPDGELLAAIFAGLTTEENQVP